MADRLDPALAAVRSAVRRDCADLEPGAGVVVACSGGADSVALTGAAVFEAAKAGWRLSVAVVDHGLQVESAAVAASVADRVRALGCDDVQVLAVHVGTDGGLESAARDARYAALEAAALDRDAVVLLGHTRDDQAETVVFRLARGSGSRSLAGMPPRRGRFRRPLLDLSRATTEQACAALGVDVWTDPHNEDARFTRSRVRHRVLPVLEAELGPGIAAALARTAWLARDDADALDAWAARVFGTASDTSAALAIDSLCAEPAAVRRRVIRLAALEAGSPATDLTAEHLAAVDRLVTDWHGQHRIDLPGPVEVTRVEGRLHFVRRAVAG